MEQDSILRTWGTCGLIQNLQLMLGEKARVPDCMHHFACLQKCLIAEKPHSLIFSYNLQCIVILASASRFHPEQWGVIIFLKGIQKKILKQMSITSTTLHREDSGDKIIGVGNMSALQMLMNGLGLISVSSRHKPVSHQTNGHGQLDLTMTMSPY